MLRTVIPENIIENVRLQGQKTKQSPPDPPYPGALPSLLFLPPPTPTPKKSSYGPAPPARQLLVPGGTTVPCV